MSLVTLLCLSAGCSSGGLLARWNVAHDNAIAPPPGQFETGDNRGRLARLFNPEGAPAKVDRDVKPASLVPPRKPDPAIEREFKVAEDLFAAGKLEQAERAFSNLDRKREHGSISDFLGLGKKKDDDKTLIGVLRRSQPAWGEKALYYLAETQYRRGKLVDAHDSIDKLLTTYPGTQYLDKAVAREYEIANAWMAAIDPKADPEKHEHWNDRISRRLPAVDVSGHAIMALEHVRQHDARGPHADDAVMKIADFHYSHGSFEEASEYYDQLIASHPKSELVPEAYRRTIDAKMKAYMGPKYDAVGLKKAKDQIHQVMTLYPELHATNSESMSRTLDLIEDQEAEITFRHGEFYKQTGYPGAAELSFAEVKARWPESSWGKLADSRLEEIARMPRKKVEPSKIMGKPGGNDPFANGLTSGSTPSSGNPLAGQGGP